jgi:sec-independent protein translocase protein TatA
MFGLGPTELIIVGVIIVFIFGAKRLPGIGKGLGGALKEFRNVKKDIGLGNEKEAGDETKVEVKSIENELAKKVIEDVPVIKKGLKVKKTADKIKKIINN